MHICAMNTVAQFTVSLYLVTGRHSRTSWYNFRSDTVSKSNYTKEYCNYCKNAFGVKIERHVLLLSLL